MPTPSSQSGAAQELEFLLIHQAFVVGNEAGGTRHFEFGKILPRHQVRMTAITSDRSYLTGERTARPPAEIVEGVRILRVSSGASLHRSYLSRTVNFLRFSLAAVWRGLRVSHVDVLMGTSPPLPQAGAAWLIAALRGKPFVLEIRDLWPEFAVDMGVLTNPILISMARRLEHFLYRRARRIVVNSPAYADYLTAHGVDRGKIAFISNGVDVSMFGRPLGGEDFRRKNGLDGKFVALYAGAFGEANDLGVLLEAAERLRNDDSIRLVLVGDGKERARLQARAAGLGNVVFTGSVPKSNMAEVLSAADVCVAILKDIPMFRTTYPNKVFDYMAAGKPTLLAIDGVIRKVIEDSGGGVFVRPGDAEAIAAAICRLKSEPENLASMGDAARAYVERNFDRSRHATHLATVLHEVAGQRRA